VTPEQITSVVQDAEAFAQAHPSDPSAWKEWALQASAETREALRRVWDNTPTMETASHTAPQRIIFEHLDPHVPTMSGLSRPLRLMLEAALHTWDDAA
jgi:hypothetical protein